MSENVMVSISCEERARTLAKQQRSHTLFVLSNTSPDTEETFLASYTSEYLQGVLRQENVLQARHYQKDDVRVSNYSLELGYRYLAVYELSLDESKQVGSLVDWIISEHQSTLNAEPPAFCFCFPVNEKIGAEPPEEPCNIMLAYTNAKPGTDQVFREFYSTQHIRDALYIPTLISGQRFEFCNYQLSNTLSPSFVSIAVYEMDGEARDIVDRADTIPPGKLDFPTLELDAKRFSQWVYRPV